MAAGARLPAGARGDGREHAPRASGFRRARQPPSAGDVETRAARARRVQLVDVETIIGTDPRQTAVTPGALVREWSENGRRYFHYRTDAADPLRRRDPLRGVRGARGHSGTASRSRVYYHPTHDVNVDRMLRSMRASLAYYSRAVRAVPVPRAARRGVSALRRRSRARIRTRSPSPRAARSSRASTPATSTARSSSSRTRPRTSGGAGR